jgi:hypothetical protein
MLGEKGKGKVLIELQYLPCIEYMSVLLHAKEILIEGNENFIKQTYRNRCNILTTNGTDTLTIPVVGGNKKVKVREIKIDYSQKWVNRHWGAIASGYGKAPFFEYYSDLYYTVFSKKIDSLFDFNFELLKLSIKILQLDLKLTITEKYIKEPGVDILDLRSKVHPKKKDEAFSFYKPAIYTQVFGSKFVENLSIMDLIFNEGPDSTHILYQSYK